MKSYFFPSTTLSSEPTESDFSFIKDELEQIEALTLEKEVLTLEINELREIIATSEACIQQLLSEDEKFDADIEVCFVTLQKYQRLQDSLNQQLAGKKSTIKELNIGKSKLENALLDLELASIDTLNNSRQENSKNLYSKQIEGLGNYISFLEAECTPIKEKLLDYEKNIAVVSDKQKQFESSKQGISAQVINLSDMIKNNQAAIDMKEKAISELMQPSVPTINNNAQRQTTPDDRDSNSNTPPSKKRKASDQPVIEIPDSPPSPVSVTSNSLFDCHEIMDQVELRQVSEANLAKVVLIDSSIEEAFKNVFGKKSNMNGRRQSC